MKNITYFKLMTTSTSYAQSRDKISPGLQWQVKCRHMFGLVGDRLFGPFSLELTIQIKYEHTIPTHNMLFLVS